MENTTEVTLKVENNLYEFAEKYTKMFEGANLEEFLSGCLESVLATIKEEVKTSWQMYTSEVFRDRLKVELPEEESEY